MCGATEARMKRKGQILNFEMCLVSLRLNCPRLKHAGVSQTDNPSNSHRKCIFFFSIGLTVLSLQYSQLGNLSVGPIGYADDETGGVRPLVVCKRYYKRGTLEPSDDAYDIDAELEHGVCVCVGRIFVCGWVGPL